MFREALDATEGAGAFMGGGERSGSPWIGWLVGSLSKLKFFNIFRFVDEN